LKKLFIGITTILLLLIIGVAAYNLWPSVTLPVSVTEPIEILDYSPTSLNLYPGESENISITVQNHAPLNYSVIFHFQLNDTAYQNLFITFSTTVYTVPNGIHILHAWLAVDPDAYAVEASLDIEVQRVKEGELPPPSQADLLAEHFNTLASWYIDPAAILVEIDPPGQMHTIGGVAVYYLPFPEKFTIEFKLKIDTFGAPDDRAVFQIYTSRSCRIFHIKPDKIEMGTGIIGFEEFAVSTDNDWHIWKLVVDEEVQEATVYKDGSPLNVFTRAAIRDDLTQRIFTGSNRGGGAETHWDYVFISTGLHP
jgi:hypothetical protein